MTTPRFSVVIATHGRPSYVTAVESVLAQSYPDFEVVVVDDAGDPPADRLDDPRVTTVRREVNGGSGAARNTGLDVARGDWVVFLDDDDRLLPGWLRTVAEAIDAHPEWSIVTAEAEFVVDGRLTGQHVVSRNFPANDQFREFLCQPFLSVICAVQQGLFWAVGGFDESLSHYEDYELWARMLRAGAVAGHVPWVLAHVARGTGKSADGTYALARRVEVLEQIRGWGLSDVETSTVNDHIRRSRDEQLIVAAREAARNGDPAAARRLREAIVGLSGILDRVKAGIKLVGLPLYRRRLVRGQRR